MCRRLSDSIFFGLVLVLISTGVADAFDLNDPDLVAYWSFDEGAGTVATDLSPNSYDGTLNGGLTSTEGIYGGALQFNGSDAYVGTGQSLLNDLAGFTLAGWVSGSNIGSYAGLFGQNDLVEFGFTSENGGQVGTWMSGNGWQFVGADYAFPYPSWHHVALTGDASRVVIYIDGEEAASDEGGMVSGSSGFPFNIGAFVFNENADPLLGEIDDVWVISRALTQEEIQILMAGSAEYPYASSPSPADGAIHTDTWVTLSWRAGDFAVSHDVYLGTNYDDVNEGAGDTFHGNKADLIQIVGFAGFPFPDGLVPGTTYYWRIDEVNDLDPNSPWKGDVWSFLVPPKKAHDPNPTDGTMFINPNVTLTWTAGFRAGLHHVYFGDNFADVEAGTGGTSKGPVISTSYVPDPLELDKTYYWRLDTTGGAYGQVTGDVWSFRTTIPGLGTIVSERWEDITTTDLDTLKQNSEYPNNPDVTEILTEFSTIPNLDQYGGRIHGWVFVPGTGDYTFWLCSDNEGELWLSTDDDSANVKLIARETNWLPPNTWRTGEEQSNPIPLQGGEKYYIMALWKEGDGGDQCQVAWQGPGVPTITIIPGSNLSPFEPMTAFGAKPGNGAIDVTQVPILEWKPGLEAASHELYFGTDEQAVANATKASPEYKGGKSLGDESYDPGKLPWESTFYWRVDEVNNADLDSPWMGNVWNFTTADFFVVDDFESYTDNDAANGAIWQHWIDGFGVATNGSQVGYVLPPYTEQAIVHGGSQSMPLFYENTAGVTNSEAALKLGSTSSNWTDGGVAELSIWFQGRPASTGSFTDTPVGTFTITASGADIWNVNGVEADEFHFAYKVLTGPGSIVARVDSVENTDGWAKAGVMIREALTPESAHAFACVTPSNGVASQGRPSAGGTSFNTAQGGITAPHWVRLERDVSGMFAVSHSANGTAWEPVQGAIPQNIPMSSNVYAGLAVTAHNAGATCEAIFSNVTITGTVSPQWASQDIGIASNDAEPLYVAVSDNTDASAVVAHSNPAAANIDTWTEWTVSLQAFADQGVNLANVDEIAIGLGTTGDMNAAGGSGKMYFDDIRLYRPR